MNKLPVVIITLIVIINAYLHLNAAAGCLDNSWHMKKFPDFKEYHAVQCNCPCWKYKQLADRNKCVKCLHYHNSTSRTAQKMSNGSYMPHLPMAHVKKNPALLKRAMTQKKSVAANN